MQKTIPTKETVRDFLIETLANEKQIEVSEANANDKLKDLGVDSFGFLEILFAIENEFNIKFPQEFSDIETLDDCLNVTYQLILDQNKDSSVA